MDFDIKKLKLGLGGLASGFINGMLGAGGGMIAVPTLSSLGLDRKKAHANSVAVIMPLSLFSAALYIASGKVHIPDALPYIPLGLLGSFLGTIFLPKISNTILKKVFALFVLWAGIRLLIK